VVQPARERRPKPAKNRHPVHQGATSAGCSRAFTTAGTGETPNIDRIGQEGALFTDYYAEQSCTPGATPSSPACIRCARDIPPHRPAARPTCARHAALAVPLDLGYNTGEFGKNHWAPPPALPTAHGFQEFWGYLYT
jgi:arylsulfatase